MLHFLPERICCIDDQPKSCRKHTCESWVGYYGESSVQLVPKAMRREDQNPISKTKITVFLRFRAPFTHVQNWHSIPNSRHGTNIWSTEHTFRESDMLGISINSCRGAQYASCLFCLHIYENSPCRARFRIAVPAFCASVK